MYRGHIMHTFEENSQYFELYPVTREAASVPS